MAERLRHLRGEDVVVLGLPRGGVSVAAEVARALDASLDVIVVRKLGVLLSRALVPNRRIQLATSTNYPAHLLCAPSHATWLGIRPKPTAERV